MSIKYGVKKWYKPEKLSIKIILTIAILLFIRMCANIPIPLINQEYLKILFENKTGFELINAFSGGAFTNMTFMALSVTPYITASIILQLLTIIFPNLAEIQKGGEEDKKKWELWQIITSVILGIIQSVGLAITFGRQGLINNYGFWSILLVSFLWTLGSIITIVAGTYISKFCIGNGISLILAINIMSTLPSDVLSFYTVYIKGQKLNHIIGIIPIALIIIIGLIVFTVILNSAQKEISVIYPKQAIHGNRKNVSTIPIKLNLAGVMPVIFASTLYSLPLMFLSNSQNKVAQAIVHFCSSTYWFDLEHWWRTFGFVFYGLLVIFFAYFYTAIVFNPREVAQNLKKSGACIPGIRPGQPTVEYIEKQCKYMTLLGAIYLFILTQVPTIITHFSSIKSLSFGGTSVIIIVGVILETALVIKSEKVMLSYSIKKTNSFMGMNKNNIRRSVL